MPQSQCREHRWTISGAAQHGQKRKGISVAYILSGNLWYMHHKHHIYTEIYCSKKQCIIICIRWYDTSAWGLKSRSPYAQSCHLHIHPLMNLINFTEYLLCARQSSMFWRLRTYLGGKQREGKVVDRMLDVGRIGEHHQHNFQWNLESHPLLRFIKDMHAKKM